MKELSLNILDIAENSVKAQADLIKIMIDEAGNRLTLTITDNGCGMTPEFLEMVTNPFCTTRTTRPVGLGLPLLKMAAEQTGGYMTIQSKHQSLHPNDHGTVVSAVFYKDHIDFTPLGDVVATVETLIQGHPEPDFIFVHNYNGQAVSLDTREVREVLGTDIPLNSYEVIKWIAQYLKQQYDDNSSNKMNI